MILLRTDKKVEWKCAVSFLFINVNHDVGYESSESIPISLGYILATLKAEGFDGVIIDDLRDRPLTLNTLEKWIRRVDPTVIGFTAYQSTMERIRYLSRYIKSRHRHVKTILGGPQAAPMPADALTELEDTDMLIRGEGEVVMLGVAKAFRDKRSPAEIPGLASRWEGGIVDNRDEPEIPEDLDVYPSPYLTDLLNLQGKDTAILLSSRGCSHRCLFCITPGLCKGNVRFHSVERVADEMEHLAARGVARYWFADPNFTEDRERTIQLLDEKIRRNIANPFWFQTRTDLVDTDLLDKLKEAGADTVAFGLESGSPGVLKATNKRIELESVVENMKYAQSLGMETELFTIFGLPGETVEDARRTLDFVRSLDIPIQSNSGSQQMQIYFGSAYERRPEKWGFKPTANYRPKYLSIGDEYESDSMSTEDMRKVRNMWALANEQMEMDVHYKQRIFDVLDFLLSNKSDLEREQAFYVYGALAGAAIEEFELLEEFLVGYRNLFQGNGFPVEDLVAALSFFRESEGPIGPMDRVIFDSRSWIDGVSFMGISGKYWDVLLGRGLLLESFERGFIGEEPGGEVEFDFRFPDDYGETELQGKVVKVHAKIHKAFTRVSAATVEDVQNLNIRNSYRFADLDELKDHNEILYYLTLRDTDPAELLRKPGHVLAFVQRVSKLGKREAVDELAGILKNNSAALRALADTLAGGGKFAWALDYYESVGDTDPGWVVKKARCLLMMGKTDQALELIESVPEGRNLEFLQTLLQCLKNAQPQSHRILSLEHHIFDLQVEAALERLALARASSSMFPPIVHGARSDSEKL